MLVRALEVQSPGEELAQLRQQLGRMPNGAHRAALDVRLRELGRGDTQMGREVLQAIAAQVEIESKV